MKLSFLNNILLAGRIILPAILCFLFNYLGNGYDHFEIIIIPFSLLIVLPNFDKIKLNIFKTLVLSLLFSCITFFASILLPLGIGYPIEFLLKLNNTSENLSEFIFKLIAIISYCIISPAIIFFWHKKLFIILKNGLTKKITFLTYIVLIVTLFAIEIKASLAIASWQFIMVLALQLRLYKDELKTLSLG